WKRRFLSSGRGWGVFCDSLLRGSIRNLLSGGLRDKGGDIRRRADRPPGDARLMRLLLGGATFLLPLPKRTWRPSAESARLHTRALATARCRGGPVHLSGKSSFAGPATDTFFSDGN